MCKKLHAQHTTYSQGPSAPRVSGMSPLITSAARQGICTPHAGGCGRWASGGIERQPVATNMYIYIYCRVAVARSSWGRVVSRKCSSLQFCAQVKECRCGLQFTCPIWNMVELRHCDEKSSRFVVGTLLPQRELNGVYRYFLHQNPEICEGYSTAGVLPGGLSDLSTPEHRKGFCKV